MELTQEIAAKVLATVDAGLVSGLGKPKPGQMCVEAAVCYALGLPHGDKPDCVAPSLRALKIRLNDSNWSSNKVRARGLRRLAVAQLGSAGALDENEFVRRVVDLAIRKSVPAALRSAAAICKNAGKKSELLAVANKCEVDGTKEAAIEARNTAAAYAAYAAAYAAADAAYAAAAYAAAYAAADAAYAAAADAAADASASYAAYAAASASAADAAADARDKSLAGYAEEIVQILIDMQAPACQWLFLTEQEVA